MADTSVHVWMQREIDFDLSGKCMKLKQLDPVLIYAYL